MSVTEAIGLIMLLCTGAVFAGITVGVIWPSKPPTHDPSTCEECKWKQ